MTITSSATPADVLDAAAAHIEDVGWSTGIPEGPEACALIAIDRVACLARPAKPARPAKQALRDYIGHDSIAGWNDRQLDAATVIAALRDAAAAWRVQNGGAT